VASDSTFSTRGRKNALSLNSIYAFRLRRVGELRVFSENLTSELGILRIDARVRRLRKHGMAPAPDGIAIALPLAVAVTMTFSTVMIQALALMPIMSIVRYELSLGRTGGQFWRDVGIITGVALILLAAHAAAIFTWALLFSLCGEFPQLARAIYHSGMNYTTLGDSDTVMSPPWRFLAPLEAANGMLMFGVSIAMLFAVIQRLIQTRFRIK
jgi:hypothetical protein